MNFHVLGDFLYISVLYLYLLLLDIYLDTTLSPSCYSLLCQMYCLVAIGI